MLKESELPPFNELAKCIKCGFTNIRTRFYSRKQDPPVEVQRDVLKGKRISHYSEHYMHFSFNFLLRTCERCSFQWAEQALDVKLEPGT